jgi:hypothetical protein
MARRRGSPQAHELLCNVCTPQLGAAAWKMGAETTGQASDRRVQIRSSLRGENVLPRSKGLPWVRHERIKR